MYAHINRWRGGAQPRALSPYARQYRSPELTEARTETPEGGAEPLGEGRGAPACARRVVGALLQGRAGAPQPARGGWSGLFSRGGPGRPSLRVSASRTVKNTFLLFKPPSL